MSHTFSKQLDGSILCSSCGDEKGVDSERNCPFFTGNAPADYSSILTNMENKINTMKNEIIDGVKSEMKVIQYGLNCVLADLQDPWENIYSETKSVIEAAEKENLEPVCNYYNIPKKHYCMVLGKSTHSYIVCAHIWPRYTFGKGLSNYGLEESNVNDPRNFLRLHKTIENAFDKKRLIFLPLYSSDDNTILLEVYLLDPSLLGVNSTISFNNQQVQFSSIHKKQFDYKFSKLQKPFLRLLAAHALTSLSKARNLGWEPGIEIEQSRMRAIALARASLGIEGKNDIIMKTFFES